MLSLFFWLKSQKRDPNETEIKLRKDVYLKQMSIRAVCFNVSFLFPVFNYLFQNKLLVAAYVLKDLINCY